MRDENLVLRERVARHGFASRPAADPAAAAALVCGIQAQDGPALRLGVRARSRGSTDAGVQAAIADRTVVRTWLMRNTIHLVAAADVRWLVALLGPMIRRRFETVRWPGLGLTPDVLTRIEACAVEVLTGRALTRSEFAAVLASRGVPVSAHGQASTHALLYLSTLGMVCRGVDRGRDATFVLLDEWLPSAAGGPRGDDTLAEFARRYFAAFSPATATDFTTWSGLPSGRAIELIRDELSPVDVLGRPGFRLGCVEPRRGVRLLPAFDNYLIGYRDRPFVAADRVPEVYVGGIIRPALLVDGRVAGRWRLVRGRSEATVELIPFDPLSRTVRAAVEREAADIGRFLGMPTNLRFAE